MSTEPAISLTEVHDAVVAFVRKFGIGTFFRTPPEIIDYLVVLEVQEACPKATAGQIVYVLEGIRESKSLKNPGRKS